MTTSATESPVEEHGHDHPSEFQYVKIAIYLGIVTAAEVAVVYITAWEHLFVPILSVMMLVKFVAVAAYFMHLKYDSKIFTRFFVLGIVLATAIFAVAIWTMSYADRLPGAS